MWTEEERRSAVVMILIRKGDILGDSDIADLLGVDRRRVNELRKALKETRDPRKVISRAPKAPMAARKARSQEFINNVRDIMETTPDRSFRSIAKDLNVSDFTIRQCVNEDLRCKSYRLQTGQFLSEGMKNRRLEKSVKLLNKLKHPKDPDMLWFFSDEKNFCQDQMHNRQNHCWVAMCPKDVPRVMKTKFPATVMVFGVVSSEGDVMPPHIFETGLRVNTDVYLEVMEQTVLPWIKTVTGDRPWVWQQDSAPCHVSNRSIRWLEENTYDFVFKDSWPPSSPDLNPMDYFVWGYLEAHTNRRAHTTKASLINSIKENCSSLDRAMVAKACASFRGVWRPSSRRGAVSLSRG